ncbi:TPR repeat-containing protein [Terrimicrobium sacchariphilum]|uniref:TPR repeat-containing protein n=1 Tax=Terrimicrobium sacchariphilum TaxID=690879 RepID=A0A146G7H7_TERSA|nr:hypothetical protein [Terrimicrobium sacchariphilum]GAT33461.1 TPR repeat-containing protein [Terrimicrobium sacchariphilum]
MRRFSSLLLVSFTAAILVGRVQAGPAEDAAAAYAKGDYQAAARGYETAVATLPSSGLYYNLAMAEMKAGDRPAAALNFRRALVLDPRMVDAKIALSEIERSQGLPVAKEGIFDKISPYVPFATIITVGSVLFWLGAFLAVGLLVFRRGGIGVVMGVVLVVIGGALAAAALISEPAWAQRNDGVVISTKPVALLDAPADQSPTLTNLPPASCVRIISKRGEWTYCESPGGEKGWLPSANLQPVIPAA